MISKDEKNLIKILVLIAALVLTVLVGKYGIGLNILPTCPNGALAPNQDVTQCGLVAGNNGKLVPAQPLVCGSGTQPDTTGTICIAITTPLQSCINSGGTWNAGTQLCTAPKLQVQCLDGSFTDDLSKCPVIKQTTTTQQQFQCANGMIVSNINQCPAVNSNSTNTSNSSNTSSFTTVLVVMGVIGVIVGSIVVFRRK